jgi:hypothetical protein
MTGNRKGNRSVIRACTGTSGGNTLPEKSEISHRCAPIHTSTDGVEGSKGAAEGPPDAGRGSPAC